MARKHRKPKKRGEQLPPVNPASGVEPATAESGGAAPPAAPTLPSPPPRPKR